MCASNCIDVWIQLNSNPWYDNVDTLLFMWIIDLQHELELTMSQIRKCLQEALLKLLIYKLNEDPADVFTAAPKNFFEDDYVQKATKTITTKPLFSLYWILNLYKVKEFHTYHNALKTLYDKKFLVESKDQLSNILVALFFFNRVTQAIIDKNMKFIVGYLLKQAFKMKSLPWVDENQKLERVISGITSSFSINYF